jgi:hypothetical protein
VKSFGKNIHGVWVGLIFQFIKLILSLKMYLGGGLAPSSQTVGSLQIPHAGKASQENDLSITQMDLAKSKIHVTWTLPKHP